MTTLEDKMYKTTHDLWDLFADLSMDQLDALESLLKAICISSDPVNTSMYYSGMIEGILYSKHRICPTCKIEHDHTDKSAFIDAMNEKIAAYSGAQKKAESAANDRPGTYL